MERAPQDQSSAVEQGERGGGGAANVHQLSAGGDSGGARQLRRSTRQRARESEASESASKKVKIDDSIAKEDTPSDNKSNAFPFDLWLM
ncbi:uncharacterized protein JCM6883_005278, partial [Sporobolomyces salmoneus]|uniref:uncharacterized protein n=1 Tax=Sporobolomyces salmoneus TaxID=183962 RepID=UPI00317D0DF3